MIQANELRIGNYVLGQNKQITKVDGFFNENKAIYTDVEDERVKFIIHYLNKCEGIELTEEILLKCGFEKEVSTVYINIGSIEIGTVANGKRFYIQISSQNITLEIKYLHQLQNLYWCLCEKELNIEL